MTSRFRAPTLAVSGVALALLAHLGTVATPAFADEGSGSAVTVRTQGRAAEEVRVQRITVEWHGDRKKRDYVETAAVPGIGTLAVVCKPWDTKVKLVVDERDHETQMWLQKYEVKNDHDVVAVKTPRVYRWSHAHASGEGGTGRAAHEGLNQSGDIENYAKGSMNGVISQRPGRNASGGAFSPRPVTTLELTWYWNGFRHPMAYRYCKVDATLRTHQDSRMGITWHGDADAAGRDQQATPLPGIGVLNLTCSSRAPRRAQARPDP